MQKDVAAFVHEGRQLHTVLASRRENTGTIGPSNPAVAFPGQLMTHHAGFSLHFLGNLETPLCVGRDLMANLARMS